MKRNKTKQKSGQQIMKLHTKSTIKYSTTVKIITQHTRKNWRSARLVYHTENKKKYKRLSMVETIFETSKTKQSMWTINQQVSTLLRINGRSPGLLESKRSKLKTQKSSKICKKNSSTIPDGSVVNTVSHISTLAKNFHRAPYNRGVSFVIVGRETVHRNNLHTESCELDWLGSVVVRASD